MHARATATFGLLLVFTLTLAAAGSSGAAAQVSDASEICPTDDPCEIREKVEVASGAQLDFGPRTIRIMNKGSLVLEPGGEMSLVAGSLVIDSGGSLKAQGGTGNPGGEVDLVLESALTVAGEIDVSGTDGGTLLITTESVNVSGTITAAGRGLEAWGGELTMVATGDVSISGKLFANGALDGDGGSIEITSGGQTGISQSALLRVDGSGFGYGGSVTIESEKTLMLYGDCFADGGNDSEGGGDGGEIELTVAKDCQIGADVTARSGAPDATGGTVTVSCDGTAAVTGKIDAGGSGSESLGGEVGIEGGNGVTIEGRVLASGGTDGDGGVIEITSNATIQLSSQGFVRADGSGFGSAGEITIDSAETLTMGESVTISAVGGNSSAEGGGDGGLIDLSAFGGCQINGEIAAMGGRPEGLGGEVRVYCIGEPRADTFLGGVIDAAGDGGGSISFQGCRATVSREARATATGVNGSIDITGVWRISIAGSLSADAVSGLIELVYRDLQPILQSTAKFTPAPILRREPLLQGCQLVPTTPTVTPTRTPTPTSSPTPAATATDTPIPAGPGDANCDGIVDALDLAGVTEAIFDPNVDQRCLLADVNGNGVPDAADFPALIEIL